MKKLPRPRDRDTTKEKVYTILSFAILFPWVAWLIIELPPLTTIFTN